MTLFDGAMGTMKEKGYDVLSIHRAYIQAGCQVLTTDTFMANSLSSNDVEGDNHRALDLANQARGTLPLRIAGDLGPTIESLHQHPLSFFHDLYLRQARALAGVDLFLIETVTDLAVANMAVTACLEARPSVPVLVSMVPAIKPEAALTAFAGLPIAALGYNCGSGPAESAARVIELASISPYPVIWQPSAGIPDGGSYPLDPQGWVRAMRGVLEGRFCAYVGGCCGTTPAHLRALASCSFGGANIY